jgi:hypothetical protein
LHSCLIAGHQEFFRDYSLAYLAIQIVAHTDYGHPMKA